MRAWSSPEVPRLSIQGPPVQVHDTATGMVTETRPEGPARLYVCGITPYDATHMGHAATYVAFDLLNRAWRNAGLEVTYVQNVTDVDDPLLERATKVGTDWQELAERETELFRQDMLALRVLAPDHYIGAVESIPLVLDLIGRLQGTGCVYELDGDLYYSVGADPDFGRVSGLDRETMLAIYPERGGDPDRDGKRDPLDCILWRRERPGEPAWDSPYGPGRPGWHIECTSIALEHLGNTFDVQGGGSDLAFPHHEMSAGHAQVANGPGVPFAQAYVHGGMVGFDGEKMSKSRGNLVFVSALRNSDIDPMAIRLVLLRHHYRSDWEWTDEQLWDAVDTLAQWRQALSADAGPAHEPYAERILAALADDLDAPTAITVVQEWVDAAVAGADVPVPSAPAEMRTVLDAALGLLL